MNLDKLPLFPLNTVVYPGLPVNLHIFEERYKALVADTLATEQHFGVVGIETGLEVGGDAEPFRVGVLVQITSVDRLEGGRLNLSATAVERIEVLSLDRESKPYLVGSVRIWPEEELPAATPEEVAELQQAFNEYVAAILREVGSTAEEIRSRTPLNLPDDPLLLSILVAGMIQVPVGDKQDLLAARSAGERIQLALRLLNRELVLLRAAHAGPALRPTNSSSTFSNN